jgi:hypothetical protein
LPDNLLTQQFLGASESPNQCLEMRCPCVAVAGDLVLSEMISICALVRKPFILSISKFERVAPAMWKRAPVPIRKALRAPSTGTATVV